MIFKTVDALLTTVPLMIITWVLYLLFKKTYSKIGMSNIILAIAFIGVWSLVIYSSLTNLPKKAIRLKLPGLQYSIRSS